MCCCSKANKDVKNPVDPTTVVATKKLATDPVCGMSVDPDNAASVEYMEAKVYFCCQGCATRFQAEPARYCSTSPGKRGSRGHQAGPGNWPRCGMALDAATAATSASRTEYTCPVRPEIVPAAG
jgi:P-type Cu+ transporter